MWRTVIRAGPYRISALVSAPAPRPLSVVLIHGYGVSGRYWRPLARLLAARYRVYVPDLPGHGQSPASGSPLDVSGMAGVLGEWMDGTGLPRAALVGNSLGCQIAAELAAADPGRVSGLVLAGPTVDPAARSAGAQLLRLMLSAPAEHPALYPIVIGDYARAGPRRLAAELEHMLRHRIEDVLPLVTAPGLVIRGTLDRIVPRRWAARVAGLLPDGRLVEIPLGGHAAHYTRARRVAAAVQTFLG